MGSMTMYPSNDYAGWWIKKGAKGRLAVVNYRPFPGEEACKHGFKYRLEAMAELERLETAHKRRRATLQVLGGLFILAAIGAQWGCTGLYADISAGPQLSPVIGPGGSNWEGDGPIVEFAVRKVDGPWFCQYAHTSNLFSGPPFNDDRETTLDRITCGRSFALYR